MRVQRWVRRNHNGWLYIFDDVAEIAYKRLPSALRVTLNEPRAVHPTQHLEVKRFLPIPLKVAIRTQVHLPQPPVGQAEIDRMLRWHATKLRNGQAIQNAHLCNHVARKAHPWLRRGLIA